ncbi:hypothetical protein BSKO_01291 [Bryopsis sp. KO-2023]|nr:hypothetical protein BSKO_01291 [Bryopsis sp. KO-2023]
MWKSVASTQLGSAASAARFVPLHRHNRNKRQKRKVSSAAGAASQPWSDDRRGRPRHRVIVRAASPKTRAVDAEPLEKDVKDVKDVGVKETRSKSRSPSPRSRVKAVAAKISAARQLARRLADEKQAAVAEGFADKDRVRKNAAEAARKAAMEAAQADAMARAVAKAQKGLPKDLVTEQLKAKSKALESLLLEMATDLDVAKAKIEEIDKRYSELSLDDDDVAESSLEEEVEDEVIAEAGMEKEEIVEVFTKLAVAKEMQVKEAPDETETKLSDKAEKESPDEAEEESPVKAEEESPDEAEEEIPKMVEDPDKAEKGALSMMATASMVEALNMVEAPDLVGAVPKAEIETQYKVANDVPNNATMEAPEIVKTETPDKVETEAPDKAEVEARKKAETQAKDKAKMEAPDKAKTTNLENGKLEAPGIAKSAAQQRAEVEAQKKAEVEAREKAESDAQKKAEEDAREKAEVEAKKKAEVEAKEKAEVEAKKKAEVEAQKKAEVEAQKKAEIEAKEKAEVEAKKKAEIEAKKQAEEEAQKKAEVEAKEKAEVEAKKKAEVEAQTKAEVEAKKKAEGEAQKKAEVEAKKKAEVEAQKKAEVEAQKKAEVEAQKEAEVEAQKKAEVEAQKKAEVEAKKQAEVEAKKQAEEAAQKKAEIEAKKKAEIEAKKQAEVEAKKQAELEAQKKAETEAREKAELEAQKKAEVEAKQKAEVEARKKAEAEAKAKAEEEAQEKAKLEARKKAEEEAEIKAEKEAKKKAEEEVKIKAAAEAQEKAEKEAREKAEVEARRQAAAEARIKAVEEAQEKADAEARAQAEAEALEKAELEASEIAERSDLPKRPETEPPVQSTRGALDMVQEIEQIKGELATAVADQEKFAAGQEKMVLKQGKIEEEREKMKIDQEKKMKLAQEQQMKFVQERKMKLEQERQMLLEQQEERKAESQKILQFETGKSMIEEDRVEEEIEESMFEEDIEDVEETGKIMIEEEDEVVEIVPEIPILQTGAKRAMSAGKQIFTFPTPVKVGAPVRIYYNRMRGPLPNNSALRVKYGLNKWEEIEHVDLQREPALDNGGMSEWWGGRIELDEDVFQMDFVVEDRNSRLVDNNASRDFRLTLTDCPTEEEVLERRIRQLEISEEERELEMERAAEAFRRGTAAKIAVVEEEAMEKFRAEKDEEYNKLGKVLVSERRAEAVKSLMGADDGKNGGLRSFGDVSPGAKCFLAYNRLRGPLSSAQKIFMHVGADNWWQNEKEVLPLGRLSTVALEKYALTNIPRQSEWLGTWVEVPEEAAVLNIVLSDLNELLWDNNTGNDFRIALENPLTNEELVALAVERLRAKNTTQDAVMEQRVGQAAARKLEVKAESTLRRQNARAKFLYTKPIIPKAGENVEVYYRPDLTVLRGRPDVYIRGSFNRWTHPQSFAPTRMAPTIKGGVGFLKAIIPIPKDAHIMDLVFTDTGNLHGGFSDDNHGFDYHIPVEGGIGEVQPLRICHVTVEMAPIAKVGGLGDVVTALGRAVQDEGNQVEVILPKYDVLDYDQIQGLEKCRGFHFGGAFVEAWQGKVEGLDVTFLEPDNGMFWTGCIYGRDDDYDRFAFFCGAALEYLKIFNVDPHVVHCHDWQTAWVAFGDRVRSRCVFTIHNLNYGADLIGQAMASCDVATTVSPTYATEVSGNPAVAFHLSKFFGIRNGIDVDIWDPAVDKLLPMNYTEEDCIEGKAAAQRKLREMMDLEELDVPIVGVVTRLTPQKGIHLIRHAAWRTLERGGQFVLLGSAPDPAIQADFDGLARDLGEQYPNRVKLWFEYNEPLSHLIFAGSDIFLVPSMFEPCGLTQMIAMRYGTVPVVRKTGGLSDTVIDVDNDEERAASTGMVTNGFSFEGADADGMDYGLNRALSYFYNDRRGWSKLVKRVMMQDWSWAIPASDYLDLYYKAMK